MRALGRYALRAQAAVERWFSYGSAIVLGALFLLTAADVILRYLFNSPIVGAYELTGYLLLVTICLSFAYLQGKRGHIALEFIVSRLPLKSRLVIDIFALHIGLVLFATLTYRSWLAACTSWMMKEFSPGIAAFPMYPFRLVVPLGAGLICLRLVMDIVHQLACLVDLASVPTGRK